MIGIALLGAGIFAIEQHLPAIEACSLYDLKAVYSRSQKSAAGLAAKVTKGSPEIYYDTPAEEEKSLTALLARDDIKAVIVCLPILTQPGVIRQALEAGKHVLSEKPIAGDAATGAELVKWHAALSQAPVWGVAENFRFMGSLLRAVELIKEIGGSLVTFQLSMAALIQEDNRFWNTPWRKVPDYQGGFLLDGGVHQFAGLRMLLGALGQDVNKVACFSALQVERLLPVDTVRAVVSTQNGASGILSVSFGTDFGSGTRMEVITTEGRVTWTPKGITSVRKSNRDETTEAVDTGNGVVEEFEAFAKSVEAGKVDPRQSPEEGLQDLRFLEALLRSGEAGGVVRNVE